MTAGDSSAHPVTGAHAALRETFAAEVTARLPRLGQLAAGDPEVLDDARRDAHTLSSSAIIVGEPEIARLAHAVELELVAGPVGELVTALQGYAP